MNQDRVIWLKHKIILLYIPVEIKEDELIKMVTAIGTVKKFRLIMNSEKSNHIGYAFVTYVNPADARAAIDRLQGIYLYNKKIKVCYARLSSEFIKETNLHVTNLPRYYTDRDFYNLFKSFGTIISSTVIYDDPSMKKKYRDHAAHGLCKGSGFIRFSNKSEALDAMFNLNGHVIDEYLPGLEISWAKKLNF